MKKLFTFILIAAPILTIYISPLPKIDLATFAILMLGLFLFPFASISPKKLFSPISIFLFYILIWGSLAPFFSEAYIPVFLMILRTMKMFMCVIIIYFLQDQFYDQKTGIVLLKTFTLIASGYLIIQFFAYRLFSILLPNVILSLINTGEYTSEAYLQEAENYYRPQSFFLEPSQFAHYALPYLIYLLLTTSTIRHRFRFIAFITIAIILSGSGIGILFMSLIFAYTFFYSFVIKKKKWGLFLTGLAFVSIICYVFYRFNYDAIMNNFAVQRIINPNVAGGNAISARFISYHYFMELPTLQKIIGTGFGNTRDCFYNSIAYILYGCGILGLLMFIYMNYYILRKSILHYQKIIALVYFGLYLMGATFTAILFSFTLVLVLSRTEDSTGQSKLQENSKKIISE